MVENHKLKFKDKMKKITEKISQVFIALKSPKTPWYAKIIGYLTIGYALSPIDLIPDFIPILGYLDDLVILPLMISLFIKLVPKSIWIESEEKSKEIWQNGKPKKWYFAIPIIVIWGLLIYFIIKLFM